MGLRYLHLRGEYIKGNLVQILREVEFIREGRKGKGERVMGKAGEGGGRWGQRARGIAIGGHSSIRGINTLELMKAPREQQASGRNVNRDRPASDPFSCTANSQGPHLSPLPSHPSLFAPATPTRCTFEPAPNPVSSATHTVVYHPRAIPVYPRVYFCVFILSPCNKFFQLF